MLLISAHQTVKSHSSDPNLWNTEWIDCRTDLFVQLTCLVHLWFLHDMGFTSLTVAHSPFETPADLQAAQGFSEGPRATILCSKHEWKNIPSTCRLLQSVKVQILYQRLNTCWVLLLQNIVCIKIKDQLVALSVVGGFYPNSQTPFSSPPKSLPAHGPVQEKDYLARTFGARGPFQECEKSNDYSVEVWFMMFHPNSYHPTGKNQNGTTKIEVIDQYCLKRVASCLAGDLWPGQTLMAYSVNP